jgi:hypothetical protein
LMYHSLKMKKGFNNKNCNNNTIIILVCFLYGTVLCFVTFLRTRKPSKESNSTGKGNEADCSTDQYPDRCSTTRFGFAPIVTRRKHHIGFRATYCSSINWLHNSKGVACGEQSEQGLHGKILESLVNTFNMYSSTRALGLLSQHRSSRLNVAWRPNCSSTFSSYILAQKMPNLALTKSKAANAKIVAKWTTEDVCQWLKKSQVLS